MSLSFARQTLLSQVMVKLKNRSKDMEIMDDLACEGSVVEQTLRELEVVNSRLGGNNISLEGLSSLLESSNSEVVKVADLGCGGGDMLHLFNTWAGKHNKHLELFGIDANPFIIDYARKNLKGVQNVSFKTENVLTKSFSKQKFDIIHCSLFLHHFTDEELVLLFSNFKQQARIGFVVNDLHRHWLAYYSIKLLTILFSKSSMVKFDAPLSVQRAFTRAEIEVILKKAGIANYCLQWKWAFRWQLIYSNE